MKMRHVKILSILMTVVIMCSSVITPHVVAVDETAAVIDMDTLLNGETPSVKAYFTGKGSITSIENAKEKLFDGAADNDESNVSHYVDLRNGYYDYDTAAYVESTKCGDIVFDFGYNKVNITGVELWARADFIQRIQGFQVFVSQDGTSWTALADKVNAVYTDTETLISYGYVTTDAKGSQTVITPLVNDYYRYVRVINKDNASYGSIGEIVFHGSIEEGETYFVRDAKQLLIAEMEKYGDQIEVLDTLELPLVDTLAAIEWSTDCENIQIESFVGDYDIDGTTGTYYNDRIDFWAVQTEQLQTATLTATISYPGEETDTYSVPVSILPKGTKITYSNFQVGAPLYDNNGARVQAHGGGIQKFTVDGVTKYYWYGEDKTRMKYKVTSQNIDSAISGPVHCYTSTDLYNWTDEGEVLKVFTPSVSKSTLYYCDDAEYMQKRKEEFLQEPYFAALYADYDDEQIERVLLNLDSKCAILERPKVIYNAKNDNYVMWFHADGNYNPDTNGRGGTNNYSRSQGGVAVSDSPTGPFRLIDSYQAYYKHRAIGDSSDMAQGNDKTENGIITSLGANGMLRDMNLFVDDDGTGYIIYSSENNKTEYIGKLNDDYTYFATNPDEAVEGIDFIRAIPNENREAPAVCKYNGKYYMMTSGLSGWNPNAAKYYVADSMMGTWIGKNNPCVESDMEPSNLTYRTQSTCILPVDEEKGKYIYVGDRWLYGTSQYNPGSLFDSRYIFLPITFAKDGSMSIQYYEEWELDVTEEVNHDVNQDGRVTAVDALLVLKNEGNTEFALEILKAACV